MEGYVVVGHRVGDWVPLLTCSKFPVAVVFVDFPALENSVLFAAIPAGKS